jgi:hypothetical protein
VDDALLRRCEPLHLLGLTIPVLPLEELLATKLLALDEHRLDYSPVLQIARALREQVDWSALRTRTRGSAYADAFFALVDGLGITTAPVAHVGAQVRLVNREAPRRTHEDGA